MGDTTVKVIKETKKGIEYLSAFLREGPRAYTKVTMWGIKHTSGDKDVCFKIGRFKRMKGKEIPEVEEPKSMLTLNGEESDNLISFLQDNYEGFSDGIKKYMPLDDDLQEDFIRLLQKGKNEEVVRILSDDNILPNELYIGIQNAKRVNSIRVFEEMLTKKTLESDWQKWFEENSWLLGTDCVEVLNERYIDRKNIVDYLVKSFDGFLDIIEIKRPEKDLPFWGRSKDHGNYYPSQALSKSITQSLNYIFELELKSNDRKYCEDVDGTVILKPSCILIYGRSDDWDLEMKESLRILNASYHNLRIMTYDQVLVRAKKMLGI